VFRVSFRLSDGPGHARDWGHKLRRAAPVGVMIVADFLDAKTFEAFIEIDHDTDLRSVTDLLAQRLGVNEYEVTEVEPAGTPTTEVSPVAERPADVAGPSVHNGDIRLVHVHPGAITRVFVHQPDQRVLYVQVRHGRTRASRPSRSARATGPWRSG